MAHMSVSSGRINKLWSGHAWVCNDLATGTHLWDVMLSQRITHSGGHTMESSFFLFSDARNQAKPISVFGIRTVTERTVTGRC